MAETRDSSFYTIVVIVALVLLIIVLVFLALQIQDRKDEKPYPPVQTTCPDYWDTAGMKCVIPPFGSNHPNTGSIRDGSSLLLDTNNTPGINMTEETIAMDDTRWTSDNTEICSKKNWAKVYGIEWDGVSNYNSCK